MFLGLVYYIIIIFIKLLCLRFSMVSKYGFEISLPDSDSLNTLKSLHGKEYLENALKKYKSFQGIYLTNFDPFKNNHHSSSKFNGFSDKNLAGIIFKGKIIPSTDSDNLDNGFVEISLNLDSSKPIKGNISLLYKFPRIYKINLRI